MQYNIYVYECLCMRCRITFIKERYVLIFYNEIVSIMYIYIYTDSFSFQITMYLLVSWFIVLLYCGVLVFLISKIYSLIQEILLFNTDTQENIH